MAPQYICYTAILGDYDDLPTLKNVHTNITYYCLTDRPLAVEFPAPWIAVPVQRYFEDDKISIGYLKSNSHLLFGDNVISIWIDASFRQVDISPERFEEGGMFNALSHRTRTTVAQELQVVVQDGLETVSSAHRLEAFLFDEGFPDDVGLTIGGYLKRDHRQQRVRDVNSIWWSLISRGHRRDQILLPFALWRAGVKPYILPYDWREDNELFLIVPHKAARTRPQTRVQRASMALNLPPSSVQGRYATCFILEHHSVRRLAVHHALNSTISKDRHHSAAYDEFYAFANDSVSEFTPPDPRLSWRREFVSRAIAGATRALEIGYQMGHCAAAMLMSEPKLFVRAIGGEPSSNAASSADVLKSIFPGRFIWDPGKSTTLLPRVHIEAFDFIHLWSGKDSQQFTDELQVVHANSKIGTLILIEGMFRPHVYSCVMDYVKRGVLRISVNGLPSSGESVLLTKVANN
jgi:hypothetical protein